MKFLLSVFGTRYSGMLLTCMESISVSHPAASMEVYWQDLPESLIDVLGRRYQQATFIRTDFDFSTNRIQRISSKTLMWKFAAERQADGECAVFLDIDTIVVRPLDGFFSAEDFDVGFSYKDEQFVLNTGVILGRGGASLNAFMTEWLLRTREILRSPELSLLANSPTQPYGGADQMSLHQMLAYQPATTRYRLAIGGAAVNFVGFPCAALNETNCVPLSEGVHVVHYKGGWQPILLDGAPFTAKRPRCDCHEMYVKYLQTFESAIGSLDASSPERWTREKLGIAVPYFSRLRPGLLQDLAYAAHVLPWLPGKALFAVKRALLRMLRGKHA